MNNNLVYNITNFGFSYPLSTQQIKFTGKISIQHSDCILLQGASGSGKSTLLRALKGLIPHLIGGKLSGEILFHDRNITTLNEQDLIKIGYLEQNPDSQLICKDVFSELAFGLENQGLVPQQISTKIEAIARRFKIAHLLNRDVISLSGGEKQKINLLSILLLEPEVLLLDEPTAFLDPESAVAVMEIIHDHIQNKTVIIIEHNLHFVQNLINRSIFIDDAGNIIEQSITNINWQPHLKDQPSKHAVLSQHNSLLTIKNLTFTYSQNEKPLLKNLYLEVFPGQIIAILGKNGSGKSTLLKLISGILPVQGMIFFKQQDIAITKKKKGFLKYFDRAGTTPIINRKYLWRHLSLLWQNPEAHFLYSSVEEELQLKPDLIKIVNLDNQRKQNPFTLSEGQKRRLSLAITFQNNPQLMLLDEPSFGQDTINKQMLAALISQFAFNGTAFIIVSHDLSFINSLTKFKYILNNGQLKLC